MSDDDAAVVQRFYAAFAQRDHRSMAACYAPNAAFSDPVFPSLRGSTIGAMWRMLCERGTDLRVECGKVSCAGNRCRTTWNAWYTFSGTGRKVHNIVSASFVIDNGLIARHDDVFDLYRWSRQALGLEGVLLGWSPLMQRAIRSRAARQLGHYQAQLNAGG